VPIYKYRLFPDYPPPLAVKLSRKPGISEVQVPNLVQCGQPRAEESAATRYDHTTTIIA
jgi:hypothetical protein